MKDQLGAGELHFWPQRTADSCRLPQIQETDASTAGIPIVDSSAEAVTLYTTPLPRRPRYRSRAPSPLRSPRGQRVDPAVTAPAVFLPPVERSSPSSGRREGSDHDGIDHEPIWGSPTAFDSDAPDIYWAKRDETGTILRLDMAAWNKRDQEIAETRAMLRKDVFLETSMSCRQKARLWRVKRRQMKDSSASLLAPSRPRPHHMPQRRPVPHGLEQKEHKADESSKQAATSRKEILAAKWAALRKSTQSLDFERKQQRLHQQQVLQARRAKQIEQTKKRELEEQRDKRERVLQRQREQLQKRGDLDDQGNKRNSDLYGQGNKRNSDIYGQGNKRNSDIYGQGNKRNSEFRQANSPRAKSFSKDPTLSPRHKQMPQGFMGTTYKSQEPEPKGARAEEREDVAKVQDVLKASRADEVAKVEDAAETSNDDDEETSSSDDEDSDQEAALEDFKKHQRMLAEQQPTTRLSRFQKRQTLLLREEKKRTKRFEREELELLKVAEEEEEPVSPTTPFEMCVHVADMYKVPLKVVQQSLNDFNKLDADGNGTLSIDEFEAEIRKRCDLGPDSDVPEHLLMKHWETIDTNKDNSVDFSEYFLWTMQAGWKEEILVNDPMERQLRELAREHGVDILDVERLKRVFDKFDVDKSGAIDKDEFKAVLCSLMNAADSLQVSQSMLNRYWKEADSDNDGVLEMQEFMMWYFNFFAS